jgi:hypothetical protein
MPATMGKKTKPSEPPPEEKAVLYIEAPASLKRDMELLARQHNRKLTGEVIQALQEYVRAHRRRAAEEERE